MCKITHMFLLRLPTGLENVSKYPDLVAELLRRGWTDNEVKDALGRNLIRVFKAVEMVRSEHTQTHSNTHTLIDVYIHINFLCLGQATKK